MANPESISLLLNNGAYPFFHRWLNRNSLFPSRNAAVSLGINILVVLVAARMFVGGIYSLKEGRVRYVCMFAARGEK